MSAKDELRRMLTESGVEWDYGITGTASTMFSANGVELTFIDMRDGVTCSTILTPAQAIAATLGPRSDSCNCTNSERTCGEWRNASSYYDPTGVDAELWCEHCDEPLEVDWGFCPHCGRRVVPDCGRKVVSA